MTDFVLTSWAPWWLSFMRKSWSLRRLQSWLDSMAGEAEGARNTEAQGWKVTGHLGEMQGVHFAWCLKCERACRGAGEVGSAADGGRSALLRCMDFSSWASSGNQHSIVEQGVTWSDVHFWKALLSVENVFKGCDLGQESFFSLWMKRVETLVLRIERRVWIGKILRR